MKVIVYAICKNEIKHIDRWVESMKEADGIYVLDTGSDDGTPERLKELGVNVASSEIIPWRFDVARNRSLEPVPEDTDICVCTDLDEVLHPGWRNLLEQAWVPGTTRAAYRYTWNFNPDGSEGCVFYTDKVHSRHGYKWLHPVHEVLTPCGITEKKVTVWGMQLDHHADQSKSRAQYLPLLELSVEEAPDDDRNMHYLGREYYFYRRWDECITTLKRHLSLPTSTWPDERCASMRYIASAYEAKGEHQQSGQWLLRAVAEAPHLREPFVELALYFYKTGDWDGVVWATSRAVAITERPQTYINDAKSWGSLPWDLRCLGLYRTGRLKEALEAARAACKLSPSDERLRKNAELIENELNA